MRCIIIIIVMHNSCGIVHSLGIKGNFNFERDLVSAIYIKRWNSTFVTIKGNFE